MNRTLNQATIEKLAEHLENAELQAYEVTKITDDYPNMTFTDATDVQWEIRRRKMSRGHKIVGMKMGLTSWPLRVVSPGSTCVVPPADPPCITTSIVGVSRAKPMGRMPCMHGQMYEA